MKFFPPEEEIRAQLRELTSQTRQLRADLQGLITRRGPSQSAFSQDRRYRLKPDPSTADDHSAPPKPTTEEPPAPQARSTKSPKKRSKRR